METAIKTIIEWGLEHWVMPVFTAIASGLAFAFKKTRGFIFTSVKWFGPTRRRERFAKRVKAALLLDDDSRVPSSSSEPLPPPSREVVILANLIHSMLQCVDMPNTAKMKATMAVDYLVERHHDNRRSTTHSVWAPWVVDHELFGPLDNMDMFVSDNAFTFLLVDSLDRPWVTIEIARRPDWQQRDVVVWKGSERPRDPFKGTLDQAFKYFQEVQAPRTPRTGPG